MIVAERKYFPELDGLRAIAVWTVVFYHLGIPGVPGSYGVVLFFVLSGFLITLLLMREQDGTGGIDLKAFYIRRTLRIMPAFYGYLIFVTGWKLFWHNAVDVRSLSAAATYTINYLTALHGDNDSGYSHAWSLAVEEQFYLLWPAMFCLLAGRANRTRVVGSVILAVWIGRTCLRLWTPIPQSYYYAAFEMRADALLVGVLMALATSRAGRVYTYIRSIERQWLLFFGALSCIACLAILERHYGTVFRDIATAALLPVFCAILILSAMTMAARDTLVGLNLTPVVWLGRISYSTYLYQQMVTGWGKRLLPDASVVFQLIVEIIAVLILACLSYYIVELPALRWRQRRMKRPQE